MAVKHETELYAPLKSFFEKQGYAIKGEVRTCDLVVAEDTTSANCGEENCSSSPCCCRAW
jgi:hypothetical protein